MNWGSACVLLLAAVAIYKSRSKRKPDRSTAAAAPPPAGTHPNTTNTSSTAQHPRQSKPKTDRSIAATAAPPSAGTNTNTSTAAVAQHLPQEVMELILSNVNDIKSVFRFKSVSKSWHSIISDPRFLKTFQWNRFYVWAQETRTLYFITLGKDKDGEFQKEEINLNEKFVNPLSSCNGLILLGPDVGEYPSPEKYYYLWDPLTKKSIEILTYPPLWIHHLYYDTITSDYKIVFVYDRCYAVYSCKGARWETEDLPRALDLRDCDAIVDGSFYLKRDDDDEIVYFDTRVGKLGTFRQPTGAGRRGRVELKAVSERLCLHSVLEDGRSFEVWVMEENRSFEKVWRKLMSMEKVERPYVRKQKVWRKLMSMEKVGRPYIRELIPVCLSNEDIVLWAEMSPEIGGFKHFIYNRRKNSLREIGFTWKYSNNYFQWSDGGKFKF